MKHDADLAYRVRILPSQVESAERRLQMLYREAANYGWDDLINYPELINEAWDREVAIEWLKQEAGK